MIAWLKKLLGNGAQNAQAFEILERFASGEVSEAVFNDRIRDQLQSMGDDGSVPRHTLHYAYPLEDAAEKVTVERAILPLNLTARDAAQGGGLIIEHTTAVAGEPFDDLTGKLRQIFSDANWEYDGWECALAPSQS